MQLCLHPFVGILFFEISILRAVKDIEDYGRDINLPGPPPITYQS